MLYIFRYTILIHPNFLLLLLLKLCYFIFKHFLLLLILSFWVFFHLVKLLLLEINLSLHILALMSYLSELRLCLHELFSYLNISTMFKVHEWISHLILKLYFISIRILDIILRFIFECAFSRIIIIVLITLINF